MGGYYREVLTAADWRQNMQLPFACVERLSLSLVGGGVPAESRAGLLFAFFYSLLSSRSSYQRKSVILSQSGERGARQYLHQNKAIRTVSTPSNIPKESRTTSRTMCVFIEARYILHSLIPVTRYNALRENKWWVMRTSKQWVRRGSARALIRPFDAATVEL